jgi:predicted glycoside hydrolase/deacetylase ChbG (UPF0249 family)
VKEIAYIADDFGLSDEANEAILHCWTHGVLTGTVLMMGQAATAAAVELAHENPGLEIGWHLHLVDSAPCTLDSWPWGASHTRAGVAMGLSPAARRAVLSEIEEQWRQFQATGLECRFANAHHHLHFHPFVRRNMIETMGDDFKGWLRWGRIACFSGGASTLGYRLLDLTMVAPHRGRLPYRLSDSLWGVDRTFAMQADEVRRAQDTLGDGLHEFMFHPRRLDDADARCLLDLAG